MASPACAHMNSFWERTYLMMRGYCTRRICVPGQKIGQKRLECHLYQYQTPFYRILEVFSLFSRYFQTLLDQVSTFLGFLHVGSSCPKSPSAWLKAEASRVKTSILQDPNVLDLHCEDFNTLEGSNSSISEFGDLTALTAVVIRTGKLNKAEQMCRLDCTLQELQLR